MIIGVAIKNFKVYRTIEYVPLSRGSKFTGLIGQNGVGKSTVLEALDCFFNDNKQWAKNINQYDEDSWVMPLFAFKKADTNFEHSTAFLQRLTQYVISGELSTDAIGNNFLSAAGQLRNSLSEEFKENYYLLPISKNSNGEFGLGVFNTQVCKNTIMEAFDAGEDINSVLSEIYHKVNELISYIYIPKEVTPTQFARFENEGFQKLLGQSLHDIIGKVLTQEKILEISRQLKSEVQEISNTLDGYVFQMNAGRQLNIKPYVLYNLIINEFFSVRELFKKSADGNIPLTNLSSGEKQRALITLAVNLITKYQKNSQRVMLAIDEPESSLHVSLCYEQFEKLYNLSFNCAQVLVSSHWYGFIPALQSGNIVNIALGNGKHSFNVFQIEKYREEISFAIRNSHNQLPIDIMLKSNNDLIQSILSSIISDDYYDWLICEGSSDKIYLDAYLADLIKDKRLRVISACKANTIKKMYQQLCLAVEELKSDVKGKIFMLIDTDAQFIDFDYVNDSVEDKVRCRRIINIDQDHNTKLVKVNANPKAPNTDIEDALNGKLFHKTLLIFKDSNDELDFLNERECAGTASYYALDLTHSQSEKLDQFFSKNNNENKVLFAREYVKKLTESDYEVPSWIDEIRQYFDVR